MKARLLNLVTPGAYWLRPAATWLFLLPFLTAGVILDSAKIQAAGLLLLAIGYLVSSRPRFPRRAAARICLAAAVLLLIVCAYLVFGSWPSSYGSASSYDKNAVLFVVTYADVAVFAALFFEARLFERVIWRGATAALWIGVLSWLASRLTHHLILVSTSHGAIRMQGTLSEPSAWAPVIPLVVLLAVRRRSWLSLGLALVATCLTASPTCLIVLVASVLLYYALTGTRRQRRAIVITLGVLVPASAAFVLTATPAQYLNSHNTPEKAIGRLLAGIQNIDTDGQQGHNTRWASTRVTMADTADNGWLLTGAGPAADVTYFALRYPATAGPQPYQPNALWVAVLFDFGLTGVAVLAVLMLTAAWRMRKDPGLCAVLLPFSVSAVVNSAEGSFAYSFVALGILLFTFRWTGAVSGPGDRDRTAELPPLALITPSTTVARDPGARLRDLRRLHQDQ